MKSSNNEGERVPTDDLLLPHKVCSPGTGLCPFELLPKRVMEILKQPKKLPN